MMVMQLPGLLNGCQATQKSERIFGKNCFSNLLQGIFFNLKFVGFDYKGRYTANGNESSLAHLLLRHLEPGDKRNF